MLQNQIDKNGLNLNTTDFMASFDIYYRNIHIIKLTFNEQIFIVDVFGNNKSDVAIEYFGTQSSKSLIDTLPINYITTE